MTSAPDTGTVAIGGAPAGVTFAEIDAAYAALRRAVRSAGLLDRAHGYYLGRGLLCSGLLAAGVALPFMLPEALGWSALAAAVLAFASVQIGLLGHDAGHHAIFRPARPHDVRATTASSGRERRTIWRAGDRPSPAVLRDVVSQAGLLAGSR